MTASLTLGTRGSDLALWQTRHVAGLLRQAGGPSLEVKEKIITTRGDVDMSERLVGKLEKGFFTEELERELREGAIDAAVHSLKDLPTRMPEGLALGAVLERWRPNDLLLVRPEWVQRGRSLEVLPLKDGARVGASSLRRDALLRRHAPGSQPVPLRGNVPTRVQRLREGKTEAIVLAAAGVERLKLDLSGLAVFVLNPRRWVPAPGQGAVAAQCRAGDARVSGLLAPAHHAASAEAAAWERDFLRVLEGGCATPFGCHVEGSRAWLGQATPNGWRAKTVDLPATGDEAERTRFINQVFEDKVPSHGEDDGQLFSEV